MKLRVAQQILSTEAEGPGRCYALWVQGCTLRCEGCCNPEMFAERGGRELEVSALADEILATQGIEGLSVLGGEPFQQPDALAELVERVSRGGRTVMIYSGFTRAELDARTEPAVRRALAAADLLVDGRYDARLPEKSRRWIGSSNQQLHFLSARYSPTDPRFSSANTVELRLEDGRVTINGWPSAADGVRFKRRAS